MSLPDLSFPERQTCVRHACSEGPSHATCSLTRCPLHRRLGSNSYRRFRCGLAGHRRRSTYQRCHQIRRCSNCHRWPNRRYPSPLPQRRPSRSASIHQPQTSTSSVSPHCRAPPQAATPRIGSSVRAPTAIRMASHASGRTATPTNHLRIGGRAWSTGQARQLRAIRARSNGRAMGATPTNGFAAQPARRPAFPSSVPSRWARSLSALEIRSANRNRAMPSGVAVSGLKITRREAPCRGSSGSPDQAST